MGEQKIWFVLIWSGYSSHRWKAIEAHIERVDGGQFPEKNNPAMKNETHYTEYKEGSRVKGEATHTYKSPSVATA